MKEIHKSLSSSIYFSPGRRYVLLGSISMDTQTGNKGYRDRIPMPWRQLFVTKIYDVIVICFISALFLFSFQYVVVSLVVYCTDETMKAGTRIQLIKSYYVAVVFLAQ